MSFAVKHKKKVLVYIDLFSRLNQHEDTDSDKANRQLCYLMFRKKKRKERREEQKRLVYSVLI
jgi:hypothetical protein